MQTLLAVLSWCSVTAVAQQSATVPGHGYPPRVKLSKETIFSTKKVLSEDMEMTTMVSTGNTSSYIYLHGASGPLTIIIRPCSSSIYVSVSHIPQNSTGGLLADYIKGRSDSSLTESKGMKPHVFRWLEAPAGLYLLNLVAEQRETPVTMYATSLDGVPAPLRIKQTPKLRIQRRLHRNRLTIRWDQSMVDPQMMHYCVVVNSRRNFTSLCEANFASGLNVRSSTAGQHKTENKVYKKSSQGETTAPGKDHRAMSRPLGKDDIFITCVGAGLSYTISDLQRGREYYFNIFAENHKTHLGFLYGSKGLKYDPKIHPVGLRDNKPMTVNIRRLGGKAIFRYKVSMVHNDASALNWHVMPCGGAVQVEVTLRRHVVVPRQTVEGYGQLQVSSPKPGQRYVLMVYVADPEQFREVLGVEVLATMRPSLLPQLPSEVSVYEYTNMRTCNSVTVGWVPVSSQSVKYCVSASPVLSSDVEGYFRPRPNQCNLDHRLRSQLDFAVKYCQDFSANDNRNVLTHTITKLRRGKEYLIQVTVKKIKGKALSYDLLRVRTKSDC